MIQHLPQNVHLYDLKKSIKYLLTMWPEIDDQGLEHEVPFNFINSDGVKIHGYYPSENQQEDQSAPMIVIPHGGPHHQGLMGF